MANTPPKVAHDMWTPGRRLIDVRDLQPDSLFSGRATPVDTILGVMNAAALSADLCIRKMMQDSRQ